MSTLSRTEQILIDRHGSVALTMDQLAREMQVTPGGLRNMLSGNRCPIETIGEGKLRRAPIINVAKWIDGE